VTSGPRVLLARPSSDLVPAHHLLESLGYCVVCVPVFERQWHVQEVAETAAQHPVIDHLILTDSTTAEVTAAAAPATWGVTPVIALSGACSSRARSLGFPVTGAVARDQLTCFLEDLGALDTGTIGLPRPSHTHQALARSLQRRGATVVDVEAYREVQPENVSDLLAASLPVDVTLLFSTSEAHHLAARLPPHRHHEVGHILCLDALVERAVMKAGLPVSATAHSPNLKGLVQTLRTLHPAD
jgi:uroporphyrinogen-III synthase